MDDERETQSQERHQMERGQDRYQAQVLLGDNQKLLAENQKLLAESQSLRAENPSLRPENPSLRPENPSLRPENPSLRPENPSLRPENPSLLAENQSLLAKNQSLLAENQSLQTAVSEMMYAITQTLNDKGRWTPKEDAVWAMKFEALDTRFENWSRFYSVERLADLEHVPTADKNAIVQQLQLGASCGHHDWDTLVRKMACSNIPPDRIPYILMHALLSRHVFHLMFVNPYSYLEGLRSDVVLPTAEEMLNLSMAMTDGNSINMTLGVLDANRNPDGPANVFAWRSRTFRNLFDSLGAGIPDLSSRKSLEFLASPARFLLRPNADDATAHKRHLALTKEYKRCLGLALPLAAQTEEVELYGLDFIKEFNFASEYMRADGHHQLRYEVGIDDTRLDGKQILLYVQPAIVAFGNIYLQHYDLHKVWCKARVILDEAT
ncbi:uncharacterized protein N7459_003317 [Penicillium hispanicum]|uniref:uncharacterized protein n=1 Tax=Penicillium hispanicum TaxID=1080232 RepID=UPI0025414F82|nr:uncharacterized protein N7459_003317 [Penicillium hispanicum]KAJ5587552.1 hypothetical protein N7459_003317 [Penicillium hispanicum]